MMADEGGVSYRALLYVWCRSVCHESAQCPGLEVLLCVVWLQARGRERGGERGRERESVSRVNERNGWRRGRRG